MNPIERVFFKLPGWIRWVCVPIVTALTATVVWFLASIAAKIFVFLDFAGRGIGENFFEYLIIPGVSIYCAIATGTLVAPKYRKNVSLLLSIVWVFAAGFLTFLSILGSTWASLIAVASICFGSGAAALSDFPDPDSNPYSTLLTESN